MQHFNTDEIQGLSKLYRLNLINSITGYKSANMIGTKSNSGEENVAIFSSITHLGSSPALLHFTLRPNTVPRDTYKNIKENNVFTVNHVSLGQIEQAHHTSAKYDENISEFDQTQLESEYRLDWHAPFVKGSPIGLGCRYLNEYNIKENGCVLIIAAIEHVFVDDQLLQEDGWVKLELGEVVAINGLDGYALPQLQKRLEYARPNEIVKKP
ncbi:MAG: flavin oxidoreductase [Bacteroidetes bacterium]|jgi:flavin reductase (DIM6/NTAB) family NADH-FMN oxidoreductase RutF|nr:flavin oxidoreductase [Flavobacteriaceae bacterium]MBT6128343.1 flavin oxidoreductase [Flavobacteriaceae bacterium]MDG1028457.1 flavin reductase [Flavobacteriaceae bacterium]MDG1941552.1 flavin reductase [Flavobacteriaceae bacterium]NCF31089.1 flavin oxidoreductase [Bacteroidota bacterium]